MIACISFNKKYGAPEHFINSMGFKFRVEMPTQNYTHSKGKDFRSYLRRYFFYPFFEATEYAYSPVI